MALLKIKTKAKTLITWGSANLAFVRSVNTVKDSAISYSGATGTSFSAGQILYSSGSQNMEGYIAVKSRDNISLNGSGTINISVEHYPSSTEGNRKLTFNIDESPANLNLYYNSKPNATDIIVETDNRKPYKFTGADFASHYSDFDNDSIAQVQITGDATGMTIDGNEYVSGTWISFADIQNGLLIYTPLDQSDAYEINLNWQAKDAAGNISVN